MIRDLLALTGLMDNPTWLLGVPSRYGPLGSPVRAGIRRAALAGAYYYCWES